MEQRSLEFPEDMHADSRILPSVEPIMDPGVACRCRSDEEYNMREPVGWRDIESETLVIWHPSHRPFDFNMGAKIIKAWQD